MVPVPLEWDGMALSKFAYMHGVQGGQSLYHKLVRTKKISRLVDGVPGSVDPFGRVKTGEEYVLHCPSWILDREHHHRRYGDKKKMSLNILPVWSDEHYMVFDKPSGMLVQRGSKHEGDAVFADLEGFFSVHRLDALTTGVLIGGRSREAAARLSAVWSSAKKIYHAKCGGGPFAQTCGRIETPLRIMDGRVSCAQFGGNQSPPSLSISSSDVPFVVDATTDYRVVEQTGDFSIVELRPHTGRKHQLRVHLASIGHSVVGDPLYGLTGKGRGSMCLHCSSLQVAHPFAKGTFIDIQIPYTKHFK